MKKTATVFWVLSLISVFSVSVNAKTEVGKGRVDIRVCMCGSELELFSLGKDKTDFSLIKEFKGPSENGRVKIIFIYLKASHYGLVLLNEKNRMVEAYKEFEVKSGVIIVVDFCPEKMPKDIPDERIKV